MPRSGQACRRGHRYVDMSFAVRSLCVAENGASQPLTLDHSFVPRTPYDQPSTPREPLEVSDVTRSSVTLSWLAPTSNDGATIVAYVIERPEHLSPTWTRVARVKPQTTVCTDRLPIRVCAENVEEAGPPLTLAATIQSLCVHAYSDIFISFQQRTFNTSA